MTALGAAIYFDHELASGVEPFESLVKTLFPATLGDFGQFSMPIDNKKARPPTRLNLPFLLERITNAKACLVAVETPPKTPDPDQMWVSVTTTPIALRPERFFTRTRCRYVCHAQFGPAPIAKLGAQYIVDALVAFANATRARAGILLWADSTLFASCLVSGASSFSLNPAQHQRVLALMDGELRWGDAIRGPQWGTFLGAKHVEQLGGITRLEHDAGCARVVAMAEGGAFLQATSIDAPIIEGHDDRGQLARLAEFLAPVR